MIKNQDRFIVPCHIDTEIIWIWYSAELYPCYLDTINSSNCEDYELDSRKTKCLLIEGPEEITSTC